jgi:hypothetical protein
MGIFTIIYLDGYIHHKTFAHITALITMGAIICLTRLATLLLTPLKIVQLKIGEYSN